MHTCARVRQYVGSSVPSLASVTEVLDFRVDRKQCAVRAMSSKRGAIDQYFKKLPAASTAKKAKVQTHPKKAGHARITMCTLC
jgi:hypothetical protein